CLITRVKAPTLSYFLRFRLLVAKQRSARTSRAGAKRRESLRLLVAKQRSARTSRAGAGRAYDLLSCQGNMRHAGGNREAILPRRDNTSSIGPVGPMGPMRPLFEECYS